MTDGEVLRLIRNEKIERIDELVKLTGFVVDANERVERLVETNDKIANSLDALQELCSLLRKMQEDNRQQYLKMIGDLAEHGGTTLKLLTAMKEGLGPVLMGFEKRIGALEKASSPV